MFPLVVCLRQWGEAHLFSEGEAMSRLLDAQGQPLAQLVVKDNAGNIVQAEETRRVI